MQPDKGGAQGKQPAAGRVGAAQQSGELEGQRPELGPQHILRDVGGPVPLQPAAESVAAQRVRPHHEGVPAGARPVGPQVLDDARPGDELHPVRDPGTREPNQRGEPQVLRRPRGETARQLHRRQLVRLHVREGFGGEQDAVVVAGDGHRSQVAGPFGQCHPQQLPAGRGGLPGRLRHPAVAGFDAPGQGFEVIKQLRVAEDAPGAGFGESVGQFVETGGLRRGGAEQFPE